MATQVLVGANAAGLAQQFLSSVTSFEEAVQKVQSAGKALSTPSEWQGASATKFEADYAAFSAAALKMQQSLAEMANGAKTVITSIDSADTSGAAKIGTFSG